MTISAEKWRKATVFNYFQLIFILCEFWIAPDKRLFWVFYKPVKRPKNDIVKMPFK